MAGSFVATAFLLPAFFPDAFFVAADFATGLLAAAFLAAGLALAAAGFADVRDAEEAAMATPDCSANSAASTATMAFAFMVGKRLRGRLLGSAFCFKNKQIQK
ncbi:MAG: hypothetical protein RBT67_06930 [Thauera sp.]|nr:hypothetical protein [Thauera sp.]